MPRCQDEFGNVCVAKLRTKVIAEGCNVGTVRSLRERGSHALTDADDPAEILRLRDGHTLIHFKL